MAVGLVGVVVIVVSSIPGLADGIAHESWPLAIWVGLSGAYALIVAGLVARRALSRSPEALDS
ncbi:MAG: hypothetical protein ABI864_04195 [Chloroflexota bacterium]